jgi:hypothetical protein
MKKSTSKIAQLRAKIADDNTLTPEQLVEFAINDIGYITADARYFVKAELGANFPGWAGKPAKQPSKIAPIQSAVQSAIATINPSDEKPSCVKNGTDLVIISMEKFFTSLENAKNVMKSRMLDLVDDGQVEPTWDGSRYHAPCDNYIYGGISYAGGQYLHEPDGSLAKGSKCKVAIEVDACDEFKKILEGNFSSVVSFGKSWTATDGTEVCYAYIEGPTYVVKTDNVKLSSRVLTAWTPEMGDVGSTVWEETLGNLKKKYLFDDGFEMISKVDIEDGLYKSSLDWFLNSNKKTTRVKVFYSYKEFRIGAK